MYKMCVDKVKGFRGLPCMLCEQRGLIGLHKLEVSTMVSNIC